MSPQSIDAKYQTGNGRVLLIRIPAYFITDLNPQPDAVIDMPGEVIWKTHGRKPGLYARGYHIAYDRYFEDEKGESYKIIKYSFYPLLTPEANLKQHFDAQGHLYLDGLPWRSTSYTGESIKGGSRFYSKMGWLEGSI